VIDIIIAIIAYIFVVTHPSFSTFIAWFKSSLFAIITSIYI